MIPVSEIFGPTIQGEGPAAGRAASFVRLGGCNLSCSWCDSSYTWDGAAYDLRAQLTMRTPLDIAETVPEAPIIVLTGGEPLLHQQNPDWPDLVDLLSEDTELHIETNGTLEPTSATTNSADLIVVSPKQSHAGLHRGQQDPTPWPLWATVPTAIVKVVVRTPEDVDRAVEDSTAAGWNHERIWVMPEGTDSLVLADRWPGIAQAAADLGINASHRLHVLAWQDRRGH